VNQKQQNTSPGICRCGKVNWRQSAGRFLTASCIAQVPEAGSRFEQLALRHRAQSRRMEQTTSYIERIECKCDGAEYLEEHRLKPDSPTRRVIAACCHSECSSTLPRTLADDVPEIAFRRRSAPEMRVMTQDDETASSLLMNLPNYDVIPAGSC